MEHTIHITDNEGRQVIPSLISRCSDDRTESVIYTVTIPRSSLANARPHVPFPRRDYARRFHIDQRAVEDGDVRLGGPNCLCGSFETCEVCSTINSRGVAI